MEINTLYHEALLAQAAYANLNANMTKEDLITALQDEDLVGGITQAQAEYFASKYIVVQQDNNTETGFSATLFQSIESGEYHLANRGTDSFFDGDWTDANASNSDYGMAYNQAAELINFYLSVFSLNIPSITHQSIALVQFTLEKLQNEQCLLIREAA